MMADGITYTVRPASRAVAHLEKSKSGLLVEYPNIMHQTSPSVLNQQQNIQKLETSLRN